ncbi:solute carrier family 35 member E1 homolog [Halyomorpha halys]|uniref:solute carrier family 35 member E1 homolog n=1 Tax=Halyomorpha halys TaxID=286706 RepID=UPI0006D4E986|nr:solute carrier family 35 member E1 homolog [Halyomorpha halys]
MADPKQVREGLTVLILCLLWYVVGSSNNVIGKMLLNDFPYPMTVTMAQLLSITLYSGPVLKLWGVRRQTDIGWNYYMKILVPLAIGKVMGSVFTHVSLWKVPVSYTHTVKATMPLFTVVLSRLILKEKQTIKVYMSLVPIILGVGLASMTEISFDLLGLLSALAATLQHSLQNIFSKKVLHDIGLHHLRLLHLLGRLSMMIFLPFWCWFDLTSVIHESKILFDGKWLLLIADGALSWLQNLLAFSVMSMVSPLTYAVASGTKRLAIISASLLILGNPVSALNLLGMTVAAAGVLAYNKAKYDARMEEKSHLQNISVMPSVNGSINHSKISMYV